MKIHIAEYDPNWKNLFNEEKIFLENILAEFSPVIEHIGSTSVEGLGAKPIIDVMVGMKEFSHLDQAVEKLLPAGYMYYRKWEADMPFRRFFLKVQNFQEKNFPSVIDFGQEFHIPTEEKTHHIHMVEIGSEFWERHLAFRDYLRSNPSIREEYFRIKKNLSQYDWQTGNDYAMAKEGFIRSVEQRALAEKIV